MKKRTCSALLLFLVVCLIPLNLLAQSEADIRSHVTGHLLYLSGLWASNALVFDAEGHLQGDPKTTSFTLSGIQVKKVELRGNRLLLEGERYGLRVTKKNVQPINLSDKIRIDLAAPSYGDFNTRLDDILVSRIDDLLLKIPKQLQKAARQFFVHDAANMPPIAVSPGSNSPIYSIGGAIKAPTPLRLVDPRFSDAAFKQKLGGKVMVHFHVEIDGTTSHVEVIQPAGLGLDEEAVIAVSQYKFVPAKYKDQPVVVELSSEVSFGI